MTDDMDEIWELYADDGAQALDAMEEAIEALKAKDGNPDDHIAALFRAVHTFKGNSRVLGLSIVESRAHLGEDLIGLVRDEGAQLTDDILDVLMLTCDHLRVMLDETAVNQEDVDPEPTEDLMEQLRHQIALAKSDEVDTQDPDQAHVNSKSQPENEIEEAEKPDGSTVEAGLQADGAAETTEAVRSPSGDISAASEARQTGAIPDMSMLDAMFSELPDSKYDNDDLFDTDEVDGNIPEEEASDAQELDAGQEPIDPNFEDTQIPAIEDCGPKLADPSYRQIFTGMVHDTMADLNSGDMDKALASVAALLFASEQLRLDDWVASLKSFADLGSGADAQALREQLEELSARDLEDAHAGETQHPEENAAQENPPEEKMPAERTPQEAETAAPTGPSPVDPAYAKIFLDMATDTISELKSGDTDRARTAVSSLHFAAEQMKLKNWAKVLDEFLSAPENGDAATLAETLEALQSRGLDADTNEDSADIEVKAAADEMLPQAPAPTETQTGNPTPSVTPAMPKTTDATQTPNQAPEVPTAETEEAAPVLEGIAFVISELQTIFERVADFGIQFAGETVPAQPDLQELSKDIAALLQPLDLIRVINAGWDLSKATNLSEYRGAELRFFEELASWERVLPSDSFPKSSISPSSLLEAWCADNIFDTLHALRVGIDTADRASGSSWFSDFETLMRQTYFASSHFGIEAAKQLSMTLIDLFSRARTDGTAPDVILIQMARGFIDTMELVFDALDQGDTPDVSRIDELFEEAANLCFLASGVVTAKSIEDRLGLPHEFHRVLSPESVKNAQHAIDSRMHFFILRSDLNEDETIAEKFLTWISSPHVRMITNVTVFEGDRTLFDFLVAATFAEDRLSEELVEIDPTGAHLSLVKVLETKSDDDSPASPIKEEDELLFQRGPSISLQLLESIGEIAAGQAMAANMLNEVGSDDIMQEFLSSVRTSGMDTPSQRHLTLLRHTIDQHTNRLRAIGEAEAQITAQLAELQEQSVAMRSRPAEMLLRPLKTFVAAEGRKFGVDLKLSYGGEEVILDQVVLDELRTILKQLLRIRIATDPAPKRVHIVIGRQEDRATVEVTDDGGPVAGQSELDKIAEEIRPRRGTFRRVAVPNGGVRIHITMPLNMVVLEGMVVRVGNVHYVLPINSIQRVQQTNGLIPMSADRQRKLLKVSEEEIVPICNLNAGDNMAGTERAGSTEGQLYVIVSSNRKKTAIPVDELLGQQLVLLRPLQGVLSNVRDMSGVAILAGGEIGMVVAVNSLVAA